MLTSKFGPVYELTWCIFIISLSVLIYALEGASIQSKQNEARFDKCIIIGCFMSIIIA